MCVRLGDPFVKHNSLPVSHGKPQIRSKLRTVTDIEMAAARERSRGGRRATTAATSRVPSIATTTIFLLLLSCLASLALPARAEPQLVAAMSLTVSVVQALRT